MKYILNRNVTTEECDWLDRNFYKGDVVFIYNGPTYGCVSRNGIACSIGGNTPFFELPEDSLTKAQP